MCVALNFNFYLTTGIKKDPSFLISVAVRFMFDIVIGLNNEILHKVPVSEMALYL